MANSFEWKKDIEKIIDSYYTYIQKTEFSNLITFYPERIRLIFTNYETILKETRTEMKFSYPKNDFVDHHKIIAMYIKSILVSQPFEFNNNLYQKNSTNFKKRPKLLTLLPNLYISFHIALTIISGWSRKKDGKNIANYITKYPDSIYSYKSKKISKYNEHFMKLLYSFRKEPSKIPVFALSHILFFIELSNDCVFYNRIMYYYSQSVIKN